MGHFVLSTVTFMSHCLSCDPSIYTSRWFTIGSIGFMLTSAIALANDFDSGKLVGEDDSTLPQRDYRATWVLMVVSGAFCIFGRL